jgi:hypothetical protein
MSARDEPASRNRAIIGTMQVTTSGGAHVVHVVLDVLLADDEPGDFYDDENVYFEHLPSADAVFRTWESAHAGWVYKPTHGLVSIGDATGRSASFEFDGEPYFALDALLAALAAKDLHSHAHLYDEPDVDNDPSL